MLFLVLEFFSEKCFLPWGVIFPGNSWKKHYSKKINEWFLCYENFEIFQYSHPETITLVSKYYQKTIYLRYTVYTNPLQVYTTTSFPLREWLHTISGEHDGKSSIFLHNTNYVKYNID